MDSDKASGASFVRPEAREGGQRMSFRKDNEAFKQRYGENAVPNSINTFSVFLEKVRKQNKWILHISNKGKPKYFNDSVRQVAILNLQNGWFPYINFIVTKKQLKELNRYISNNVIKK